MQQTHIYYNGKTTRNKAGLVPKRNGEWIERQGFWSAETFLSLAKRKC